MPQADIHGLRAVGAIRQKRTFAKSTAAWHAGGLPLHNVGNRFLGRAAIVDEPVPNTRYILWGTVLAHFPLTFETGDNRLESDNGPQNFVQIVESPWPG